MDHLEAQPSSDLRVVFLGNRPKHDPFPLNLGVENARPLGERNKLIHEAAKVSGIENLARVSPSMVDPGARLHARRSPPEVPPAPITRADRPNPTMITALRPTPGEGGFRLIFW
jgi:hypothetical protein